MASVDGGDAPSEPTTNGLPEALRLVRVRFARIVHESVDVDDEIGSLELQAVEVRLPLTLAVDDVCHHAVDLVAVLGLGEAMTKAFGEIPVVSSGWSGPLVRNIQLTGSSPCAGP